MNNLIIIFQISAAFLLVVVAVYSAVYFFQIIRVESQAGLKIPAIFKKFLGFMTMMPMIVSLAVLLLILITVL